MGKTLGYGEITVANMTEPFTVMLTNEAQQFATDSNRKVTSAQSYYTDIIVIRGSQERTDYTIGNITSGSGITVSKSSKRVTFSVSAGTTIGADTGVIEIPITLDGQTVKKQFSWSCGKQGPQGVKGQDGTSIKITSKSVTYQTSTSGTTAPTGTWSTTVPTVNNGQYLWTKTTVQYSDGNKTEAYSVSYKGTNGTNGASVTVSKTEVTYQVSTSGTTAPTGTWSKTMPSCDQGQYLWTKTYVKYSDGKETTSYSVSYKGVDGKKFAFNMLRETNQGNKNWDIAWGKEKNDGNYVTESFTDEDGTNGVKFTCTEKTTGWLFAFFKDYKMLETLKPATKYVLSFDIKTNIKNSTIKTSLCTGSATDHFGRNATTQLKGDNTWEHVVWNLTTYDPLPKINKQFIYLSGTAVSYVGETYIKNLKLTEGTVDTPWAPHPEDLEGRGVSETVQYYLATSQASGVTSSTSGWSTDITTQKLTADKKYLWNCYQTKYSDGTSEPISTPKVIGVYGDKGQNAKNLSITPSSQYFKSTDGGKTFAPNTITIKPTIQGEISFGKWQYSIDGGVSFVDVVSGQKGLTISNNVLTVSKDSSLYSDAVTMVTFRAVADDNSFYDTCSIAKIYDVSDIQIGGRNLAKKGCIALWDDSATFNDDTFSEDGSVVFSRKSAAANSGVIIDRYVNYEKDEHYIVSFKMRVTSGTVNSFYLWNGKGHTNNSVYVDGIKSGTLHADVSFPTDDQYHQITAYFTATGTTFTEASDIDINHHLILQPIKGTAATYTVQLLNFKIEKGNKATDWTPAPEDVQTAILSTKSEISDVSLKVDKNKQAIEQRVEKTTYQQDLNLVKGDISKANEGLNKWRYEIYPKSLFADKPEDQRKISLDVFARNKNIIPTQSILLDDTKLGYFNYDDNYIGYAVTFVKMSEATKLETTFVHDDAGSFYLNGKLICTNGTNNFYSSATPDTVSCTLVKGWNCLEVVINEGAGSEGFKFGTVLSQLSTCQLMNCYYAMVTGRESQITNTLVQNTIDIEGVSTKVGKVTSIIGENGENFTDFKNEYSDFKQTMNGFKTTVGQTYVTKDDFNGLEIGGRNLLVQKNITEGYLSTDGKGSFVGSGGGDQTSDWIDVSGNKYITITLYEDFTNTNNSGRYCEYDADKNCISTIDYNPRQKSSVIIELKSNTKYIRVTAIECKTRRYKIEKGNKATDWTPAPEDVNGKIVNATSIAQQAADKFSWIVKSGTSSSNFEITDRLMNLVSANINLDGIVSFMNTAKGDGRKNLYNLDYSSFENVASQEDAICYAKDNGVTSVGIDSSVSYDGDKSLKISYTTANLNSSTTPLYLGSSANNYGCVKIQAGKQYILSCYVKSDSTTGLFMIDIQGHDTPDTKTDGLYLSNIDPRKLPGSSTGVNLSTDWQRAVCAIKVADNATGLYWSVVPLIWGRPSSSSAPQTFNVWVDCIMLEEVDSISNEPGTYIFDKETIIDGGSIKTDTITGNQILAGSITADKIATDAIKSHNYISSGGTQGSFLNLGDGSFQSPNLSWDANGNLIASNANIIGNLTAGTVGEWKIDKYIYSRDKMFFDINKHNGQSIYNKNSTNNLFLGDGKVSSFYWFTTQNNTFIIENGNSPQYATGPAGISFGTNIAQGQIELYESVYPGNIIQDYEQTSHTSELSISGSKISFSYYDSNGSSFSDSPYTYIMADYARFYGDIFVQGSITTDEGVDVGGKLQASSIATKNGGLIETAGTVYGGGEIQCGGGQMRIIGGNYGILLRNDGSDFYILSTDSGSPWGSWNSKRPFRINLANGIPYFEYGIIIPNENYLLGNGYQLARGTSWGGVCIGDDSKRLRLYGTSIWASHSISTSDENLKENFTTLDQYEEFYMNLNPIGFNYIGDYDGKKTHFGFGAHKIEDILESEGYDADKFAVVTHRPLVQEDIEKRFGKDVTVDIETEYGVSYAEFIALNTHMIQKTRRELTKVKQEKADLEARLQIIEAKLGL